MAKLRGYIVKSSGLQTSGQCSEALNLVDLAEV